MFLFLNSSNDKETLEKQIPELRKTLELVTAKIELVELTHFCGAKHHMVEIKPLRYKKISITRFSCE